LAVPAMTDIVERLREPHRGKTEREAADEIERLRTDKDQLIAIAADEMRKRDAEIKRLKTENEQWRKLNSERVDEIAGLIHRLREAATAIERLRAENAMLRDAILKSDDAHWTPAMRAALTTGESDD